MNNLQPEISLNGQDYYELRRMSNSAMSNFKRSPRHYLYYIDAPKVSTPAMTIGSAFHCWVLENDKFDDLYCSVPVDAPDRPTAAMRNAKKPSDASIIRVAYWNDFEAVKGNKIQLKAEDFEMIKRMGESLLNHAPARELLDAIAEVEKPLLWKDDVTGIEMKGKMDGCNSQFTIDLKSCINAHPESVTIDAFNNAHHRQAALYLDGRAQNKMAKGVFYFMYCEKEAPYGISVMKCASDFIRHGRQVYGSILEDFRYWIEMGSPNVGYEWKSPFGYHDLNLPAWVK